MQTTLIEVEAALIPVLGAACAVLALRNAALRRETEALAAELRGLRAAQENLKDLPQFTYAAAHDLQSPLRKASAFATLLKGRLGSGLDAQDRDLLERLMKSLEGMQGLIDSLLKLARASAGGPPQTVDLSALAADVVAELDPALADNGGVRLTPLPVVRADPAQMRQLLQNLVGNALKFRRPGRPPAIRIHGGELADGRFELVVEDDGVGFNMKDAGRLFQPFQRLHGLAEFPGHGIGLAICGKIVARHGGTITADAVPDRGATFRVILPRGGFVWKG